MVYLDWISVSIAWRLNIWPTDISEANRSVSRLILASCIATSASQTSEADTGKSRCSETSLSVFPDLSFLIKKMIKHYDVKRKCGSNYYFSLTKIKKKRIFKFVKFYPYCWMLNNIAWSCRYRFCWTCPIHWSAYINFIFLISIFWFIWTHNFFYVVNTRPLKSTKIKNNINYIQYKGVIYNIKI